MSKSKGNGIDPVEIIDGYGADALRFALTTMATETQDVRLPVKKLADGRNTSEKFDLGRNFCNKLWNAARFALSSLGGLATSVAGEPVDESKWSLPDRWIVSRFNRALLECGEALKIYRFDQYAKSCYDFFWRDFCDWYVETIKPSLKDPTRAAQTAHVLASVLDGALRLMHPMIPFITETIWWKLNDVRPQRGLPNRIDCEPGKRLIKARWPEIGQFSEAAEFLFPKIQEIVAAIRNVRNEHKVDQKKSVAVSILATGDAVRQITENREVIELLATCEIKAVAPDLQPIPGAARATAAGCEIFIEGTVDESAEKERSGRRRDELTKTASALRGRLSNESYIAKAPSHLVQQTRDQLAEAEAELAKLQ
jgi:valyl-tRNA synthetase